MNGEQFNHLSTEIRELRAELTSRMDSFLEKLDRKPNKDEIDATHTRLTKHQSEYEESVREIRKEVDELNESHHAIEKRMDKTETKLSIFWKIFAGVGFILGVLSQSDWFSKLFGG